MNKFFASSCALAVVGLFSVNAFAGMTKGEPIKGGDIVKGPVKGGDVVKGPVKGEPVQQEPVQQEPVKQEPIKNEPVQQEPVQQEPIKSEPVQQEAPVKMEPVKGEQTQGKVMPKESGKESTATYRRVVLERNLSERSFASRLYHSMFNYGRYIESYRPIERGSHYIDGNRVYMIDGSSRIMCERSFLSGAWGYGCDMYYPNDLGWSTNRTGLSSLLSLALRYDFEHGRRYPRYGRYDGYPGYYLDGDDGASLTCYNNRFGSFDLTSYRCAFNINVGL